MLVFLGGGWGCRPTPLMERRDGETTEYGRQVPGEAYAWYLRGQHHELSGELVQAEYAYSEATKRDPRSGSAWAKLLATRCALGARSTWEALERGEGRVDEPVPLLVAASRCARKQGALASALRYARAAIEHDPRSGVASQAFVEALRASGDESAASSATRAYLLFRGHPLYPPPLVPENHQLPSLAEARARADRALLAGQLERARHESVGQVSDGELALRALLLGQTALALELATKIAFVDPKDGEARLVLAFLAEAKAERPELMPLGSRPGGALLLCAYALYLRTAVPTEESSWRALKSRCPPDGDDPLQEHLARLLSR